jgi:anti-sigma factor RsiW
MNCRFTENELALFVEGDLPPAKIREVEVHVLSCGGCREVVEELRETQSLFKGIRQETVSPQALAHLRTRVLGQVAARNLRPSWGRWVYALAGVAFVVAVAVGVGRSHTYRTPLVQQVIQQQSPELQSPPFKGGVARSAEVVINEQPPRPRPRRVHPSLERRGLGEPQKSMEPPKETMVKLYTDDPNIVIYWLIDQKGDSL